MGARSRAAPMRTDRFGLLVLLGATAVLAAGCDDSPTGTGALTCTSDHPALEIGGSVSGALTPDDPQLADDSFYDVYSLTVEEKRTITVRMTSPELDSFLFLLATNEDPIAMDNDGGTDQDAEIAQSLARGCYLVMANSWRPQTGSYTLSAEAS